MCSNLPCDGDLSYYLSEFLNLNEDDVVHLIIGIENQLSNSSKITETNRVSHN